MVTGIGKTVELAIQNGMKQLDSVSRDELDIEIVDEGVKGLLGFIGGRDAVVQLKIKFDPEKIAKTFLKEVTLAMGLVVDITCTQKDGTLYVDLKGDNLGVLIGKRGYTLDSLQYLVSLTVNKGQGSYCNIVLDVENYRERRKESLMQFARNLGKKVKKTRRPAKVEPMSAYERRVIHMALQNDRQLKTSSEGTEPNRYVVISLAK